jgi:hypothetical protein
MSLCFLFEPAPEVGFEGFERPTLFGFTLRLLFGQGPRFGVSSRFFLLFAPSFRRGLRTAPLFELGLCAGLLFGDQSRLFKRLKLEELVRERIVPGWFHRGCPAPPISV